ncbi:MAG: Crp/Fnr family transcriptional regulator [Bacteroidia bacterium]|nr:Crp/Fnr family transcriptional regulator [Bacteroidia bacterium]
MKQLLESFGEMAHLSEEAETALMSIITKKNFKKKELLLSEGKICDQIYFVEKGIARAFYYKNGKELTFWLADENEFVGAFTSFFSRTPSNKYIETLEDSTLWIFDYHKLEALYSESKELERMGRLFVSYGLSILEKKFDDFHALTALERYTLLVNKHPRILQTVSLGIIASYLGISQETLSRIRNQA